MKLNYITCALLLGATSLSAMAQGNAASMPAGASATTVAPKANSTVKPVITPTAGNVAPVVATPTAQEVNPFSGVPLTYEQATLSLAIHKLQTSILDEQVKQASLRGDLANVPVKKQAEAATVQTSITKEQVNQKELLIPKKMVGVSGMGSLPSVVVPPVPVQTTETKSATKNVRTLSKNKTSSTEVSTQGPVSTEKKAEPEPKVAVASAPVVPEFKVKEVQAIMNNNGQFSAILNTTEGLAIYKDGSNTPWGTIQINEHTVAINGAQFQVHSTTLGRFANEKKPVKDEQASNVQPGPTGIVPSAPATSTTGLPPGLPADFGKVPNGYTPDGIPVSSVIGLPSAAKN